MNSSTVSRSAYSTDLSDEEWKILEPLLTRPQKKGRKPSIYRREITNAIFYVLRTGCQWRNLPHDFPKWKAVYSCFSYWKIQGTWEKINNILVKRYRLLLGRLGEPSVGIIDSQSAKTTEKGGLVDMMQGRK